MKVSEILMFFFGNGSAPPILNIPTDTTLTVVEVERTVTAVDESRDIVYAGINRTVTYEG